MSSREAFKVMEDFIADINHIPTHNKFIDAISRKKPFGNFNHSCNTIPTCTRNGLNINWSEVLNT